MTSGCSRNNINYTKYNVDSQVFIFQLSCAITKNLNNKKILNFYRSNCNNDYSECPLFCVTHLK